MRGSDMFTKYIDKDTGDLSVTNLAKGYEHLAKMQGVPADQILRLPKADDAEGWAGVYDRLGRPAEASAYAFNGIELKHPQDKAFVEGFRDTAHAAGFTQNQMDAMMGYLDGVFKQSDQALEDQLKGQRTAAEAALKTAWGDMYDIYRNDIPATLEKLAIKAKLFDPSAGETFEPVLKALNEDGLADNPAIMRVLAVVTDMVAEPETLAGTGRATGGGQLTKDDAQAAKDSLYRDAEKNKALNDRNHPQHKSVIEERDRYNKIIAGG